MPGNSKQQVLCPSSDYSTTKTLTYMLACTTCSNRQCFQTNCEYARNQNDHRDRSICLAHHQSRICNLAELGLVVLEINRFPGLLSLDTHRRNLSPRFLSLFRYPELSATISTSAILEFEPPSSIDHVILTWMLLLIGASVNLSPKSNKNL
jgi:hypothetical protein